MKGEKGAATLVEYSIVLPIVFMVVFLLISVGFTMHQKAVMESATHRAAIYIARSHMDPSYTNIVHTDASADANDIVSANITSSSIVNAPYRYLFAGNGVIPDSELSVSGLIAKNQIFIDKDPTVTVTKKTGVFSSITICAVQDFDLPGISSVFGIPPIFTIETQSTVYINQPAEFIRNADYITDIIVDVTGPIVDKLTNIISKISFFLIKI